MTCRASVLLAWLSIQAGAQEGKPSFHAPFDTGTAAKQAAGSPVGNPTAKLVLSDGIMGKGVITGVDQGKALSCAYEAARNLNAEQGTVSLWLKPLDWDGKTPHFQVFFSATGKNSVMHIYRYHDVGAGSPHSRKLLFLFGPAKRDVQGNWQWTIASSGRAREWKRGAWHHVACSWDAENLTLYLDGQVEDRKRIRARLPAAFDRFAVGGFDTWSNTGGTTLIDELKIYRVPATAAQTYTEWQAGARRAGLSLSEQGGSFGLNYLYTSLQGEALHLGLHQPYPLWSGKAITAHVRLRGAGGETVLEGSFSEAEFTYEVHLDIGTLPPGAYDLHVSFVGVGGAELAELHEDYRKFPAGPAPWEGNRIGLANNAPAPWTPVEVSNGATRCWGREYRFGDGPLPHQIVSQGIELLRSPVSMSGVIDGKEVRLRPDAMTWKQASDTAASFNAEGRIGSVAVRSNGTLEFDGFLWLSIVLDPATPTRVSKLVLDIPFRKDRASLRNLGHYRLKRTDAAPREGTYFKNLAERPIFWLGNEDIGVQWFAENLKNWQVKDFERTLEVRAEQDRIVARLNIIDVAAQLDGPRGIAFGLQATPVRPKPRRWRRWRLRPWRSPRLAYNLQPWFTRWTTLFNYPKPSHVAPGKLAGLRAWPKSGAQTLAYLSLTCATPHSPEFRYYGERWRKTPESRVLVTTALDLQTRRWAHCTICPNEPSYRDFYLWLLRPAVHELGLKGGLYFDQAVPRMCESDAHGCLWHDQKGRPHRTLNILGTRELAKRIYVVMKSYSPDALIAHHMSGEVTMPVNAFSDLMVDGENLTGAVGQAGNYYRALPLDTFRAEYVPRQWGPIPVLLPQHARAAGIFKTRDEAYWYTSPEAKKPIDYLIGLILIHDAVVWPAWEVRPDKLWRAQDAFGWDDDLEFLPYWANADYVRVTEPDSGNVVVSVFKRPGKIMLVPLNHTGTDIVVKISLALTGLGLPGAALMRLRDTYHGGEFRIRRNVADIPMSGRGFRMLVASGESLPTAVPAAE